MRNKKIEKLKNNYLINESELYPFTPRFTHSEYSAFPNRIFSSVNNFIKIMKKIIIISKGILKVIIKEEYHP